MLASSLDNLHRKRERFVNKKHSPGNTRTSMSTAGKDHSDDSSDEYDDDEDQADDNGDSVFPKTGRLLPCVHDGGATAVDGVIRLYSRARGSRIVALELLEVADRLRHRFEHDLGQRVLVCLGILGEAACAVLTRHVLGLVLFICRCSFMLVGLDGSAIIQIGVGHG